MKQPDNNKPQQRALDEIGAEPIARHAAAPALLFGVLAAFLFWGDTHILSQGGEFDPRVHYPFVSSNDLASFAVREPEDPLITRGRGVFSAVCKACHMDDGLGNVGNGCPPLVGSDWALAGDPSRISAIVLKGLTGPITVSGKEYGTGTMLALDSYSDEDIAGVLSFVRSNWGNKAPPVNPALVKKVRALVQDHPGNINAPELKKRFP